VRDEEAEQAAQHQRPYRLRRVVQPEALPILRVARVLPAPAHRPLEHQRQQGGQAMSRRTMSLPEVWAERLGIDGTADVAQELAARFEHLTRFVLTGEMPRPGAVSAEAATAHGDLWVLAGFLTDAHTAMTQEVNR
jgi:hypothetical protein